MEFADVTVKESPGLCRCCLSEGCYKDLGSEYSWMNDTEVYADMLLDCFDIGITQHNDGPNGPKRLICEVCITRLRDACNFKKQVVDSEKKFIDMLGRGEFRGREQQTVLLPMYTNAGALKAEAIEEVNLNEDYDDTNVEYLEDVSFTEDDEAVKAEVEPTPSTSTRRGRPRKTDVSETPEKKPKLKSKTKVAKDVTLKNEQQLAALLINIIQNSTILPFRWYHGKFMCFYCPTTTVHIEALREHNLNGHNEINITDIINKFIYNDRKIKLDTFLAKCCECNEDIYDINYFIDHLSIAHKVDYDPDIGSHFVCFRLSDGEMACIECGDKFTFFGPLLIHTNKIHVDKHICEVCGQGVAGKSNMLNHARQIHGVKSCKYCKATFQTQYALLQHITTRHKAEVLKCSLCGDMQKNQYGMKRHLALVHDCKESQIVCEYCSKIFTRNNKYIEHKHRVHFKMRF